MKPWYFGNTTVRSPFRLRDGLIALASSQLQGNLHGKDQEIAFRRVLGECGVVELGEDGTFSLGRKWRSAMSKLGFLYPKISSSLGFSQADVGLVDTITPNGWSLVNAETVPAMQECFLRSLAAHYIPSPVERDFNFSVFSPLRHTLSIMLELERQTGESYINFIEMALVVQFTSNDDELQTVVRRVLELRLNRDEATNKRHFDYEARDEAAEYYDYRPTTFNDYADLNLRYIKATGLVKSKGRGISLAPEKHVFIQKLVQDKSTPDSDKSYFLNLCKGASLPTDDKEQALSVLGDLLQQLKKRDIPFDVSDKPVSSPAEIAVVRHNIEGLLAEKNEEEYANKQATEWEEIAAYMELISYPRRSKTLSNGEEIKVPQAEVPAYFEWVLWRAFLAINSLVNKPYEARRFKIDQDFLPVGTAPGNGPDLIFEFYDFVLVVEVTLTTNSRQEAAEGEPVRRHVANLVIEHQERTGKPVYGLFIANKIDSNTAETFRIGVWYTNDDSKMKLDIIPVKLESFKSFFEALFKSDTIQVQLIRDLLEKCGSIRAAHEAPAWKREIEQIFATQDT